MRKKLPIGIQSLQEIREGNFYYVDKSGFALQLIDQGKYYFRSRPRRFGKSLFLDTLKELFEGNPLLFQELAAYEQWDWSVTYSRSPASIFAKMSPVIAGRETFQRPVNCAP